MVIDRKSGEYSTFRSWQVVSNEVVPSLGDELTLQEAHAIDPKLQPGDLYEVQIENPTLAALPRKPPSKSSCKKVREAERAQVFEQYQSQLGQLINGTVKKVTR